MEDLFGNFMRETITDNWPTTGIKGLRPRIYGKQVIMVIDDNRNAMIELNDINTVGDYNCLDVSIVNKMSGVVTSTRFLFKDLDLAPGKKDLNSLHACQNTTYLHRVEWYISKPRPESLKKMMVLIEQWIRAWE